MKILVLSDNHFNSLNDIDFKSYDWVIHCGDCGNQRKTLLENKDALIDLHFGLGLAIVLKMFEYAIFAGSK